MIIPIFDMHSGIVSDIDDVPTPALEESFRILAESSGKGWVNASRIQREAVSFIGLQCGNDLTSYLDPGNKLYPISNILEQARDIYTPFLKSTRTIWRWLYYFMKHRRTMAHDRQNNFVRYCSYKKNRRNGGGGVRRNSN